MQGSWNSCKVPKTFALGTLHLFQVPCVESSPFWVTFEVPLLFPARCFISTEPFGSGKKNGDPDYWLK